MANDYRNFFEQQRQYYDNLDAHKSKTDKQSNTTPPPTDLSNQAKQPPKDDGNIFSETKDYKQSAQTFKDLADYYGKNGEDKLISDIFTNVKAQKAAGKLNNEQIMQFAKNVYPMLNKDQKEKLGGLLKQLLES